MKQKIELSVCALVVAALSVYYLLHAGYLAIPSEDYLGNIFPFSHAVLTGNFHDIANKLLPSYPILIAAVSLFFGGREPVLTAALVVNFVLVIPYFITAYIVYSRFLSRRMTAAALFFLAVNSYTLYTAINPELEIFLATLTLLTFVLMDKKFRGDTFVAMIVAATKWDSVFIVPAVAWRRFWPGKKYKKAIIPCAIASALFVFWAVFMFALHFGDKAVEIGNTYIGEITRRGPNIYRFLFDAFLVPSGFVQWAGLDMYYSWKAVVPVLSALAAVVFGIVFLAVIIAGIRAFIRINHPLKMPIAIYTGGFFLVHMIYQNTKDKYVLPIVWLMVLVAFIGVEQWLLPFLKERTSSRSVKLRLVIVTCGMALVACAVVIRTHDLLVGISAVAVSAAWMLYLYFLFGARKWVLLCVGALSVFVVGMNFSYGKTIFDHYSLRRLEFRLAGEWFRENVHDNRMIFVSEETVVQYFSDIPNIRVLIGPNISAKTLDNLDSELRALNVEYVYIDNFYIKRLQTHDKNAIDRKAPLIKKFREKVGTMEGYTLVKTIPIDSETNGYIYRVDPIMHRRPSPTIPDWKYELGL